MGLVGVFALSGCELDSKALCSVDNREAYGNTETLSALSLYDTDESVSTAIFSTRGIMDANQVELAAQNYCKTGEIPDMSTY